METKSDFVSALLAIGDGGVEFFASCLLHLDPDELKACRLVNSAWDEFVRKEVWGRRRRRLLLKEKLVERWKNIDPAAEQFGHVRMTLGPDLAADGVRKVDSIFCNNSHVFCGLPCGKVGVFCLTTGCSIYRYDISIVDISTLLKNIDIDINIDMVIFENIDIDIDKAIPKISISISIW